MTEELNDKGLDDSGLSMEEILHLLYISTKFEAPSIGSLCKTFIKEKMDVENTLVIYETIRTLNEPSLEQELLEFIEK